MDYITRRMVLNEAADGGTPTAPSTAQAAAASDPAPASSPDQQAAAHPSSDPQESPQAPNFKDWTPEQFEEWKAQREGELIAKVKDELRAEREREEAERRRLDEARAAAQSDMEWATELDRRLDSDDPDVRSKAREERDQNRERFNRGLSLAYEANSAEKRQQAVAEFYAPLLRSLVEKEPGVAAALKDADALAKYDGNHLLALVEYGKDVARQTLREEIRAEVERELRVGENAGGARSQPSVSASPAKGGLAIFDGIDRTKPGAGTQMMQAALQAARKK